LTDDRLVIGHLYPDLLNIYADRGNIAVLTRRSMLRGIAVDVRSISLGDAVPGGAVDLFYIGGGQDRDQARVAPDLLGKAQALQEAVAAGSAVLAVCGGYQFLGRFYRDVGGRELPGAGLLPVETVAGTRRMIGDVLIECDFAAGGPQTVAGFENHAGRTRLDPGAEPLGRVIAGFGNDGESGFEGCRQGRVIGTYLHGPLLPRNPWLADWLIAEALARRAGAPPVLDPLPDELERQAYEVAARRARERGGRY
jgi:CobQ-like glutamine amidotransferase family enzyme